MSDKNKAVVRVDSDVLDALKSLSTGSEMSIGSIASAAIRYALEHVRVQKTTKTIEVKTIVFMEG